MTNIIEEVRAIAEERERLRAEIAALRNEHERKSAEIAVAEARAAQAASFAQQMLTERDHAREALIELMQRHSAATALLTDGVEAARHAGFRPTGATPKNGDDGKPVPAFLHEPLEDTLRRERTQ